MDASEYRLMAEVAQRHWWYVACRRLLGSLLAAELGRADPSEFEILDAGCGVGATGGWLGEFGQVIALDNSPDALALYGEAFPRATRIEGSIERIELPNSSVDLVVCVTVLYHAAVNDPGNALDEFFRVLKPGGALCLLEPGMSRFRRGHDEATHGARRFDLAEIRGLVARSGLSIEKSTGAFSFLVPPAWVLSKFFGSRSGSDLSSNSSGLFGLFGALAAAERWFVRRMSIPFGLSVVVIGRKPSAPSGVR